MKRPNRVAVITGGNSGIGLATAKELKQRGIRVIIMGRNAEGITKAAMDKATLDQVAAGILAGVPLQRFGTSEEIARSVVFLASDDALFITGQELVVDGGMSQF